VAEASVDERILYRCLLIKGLGLSFLRGKWISCVFLGRTWWWGWKVLEWMVCQLLLPGRPWRRGGRGARIVFVFFVRLPGQFMPWQVGLLVFSLSLSLSLSSLSLSRTRELPRSTGSNLSPSGGNVGRRWQRGGSGVQ
jgi:hypothetical protein